MLILLSYLKVMFTVREYLCFVAAVIPKSVTPDYIHANIQLDFVLCSEDIYNISLLCRQEKYAWDPSGVF